MSCRERRIRDSIFDYVDGNLSAQFAESVAEHLQGCPECRGLESEYRRAIAGLKAVLHETAESHVPNETLVQYVDNPEALADREREAVELHVAVCSSCGRKIEMLREVALEESSRRTDSAASLLQGAFHRLTGAFRRWPSIRIASAGLVATALVIVGMVMVERRSQPTMEIAPAEDVVWLNEPTRQEQTPPPIRELHGWINVGARFRAFFDEESYEIQLQSADGLVFESLSIDPKAYADSGVRLRIRTSSLDPGVHRLMLVACKVADESFCVHTAFPFTLVKE